MVNSANPESGGARLDFPVWLTRVCGRSEATASAYARDMQAFRDWAAGESLSLEAALSRPQLGLYLMQRMTAKKRWSGEQQQLGARSAARIVSALRMYQSWLRFNGELAQDAGFEPEPPKYSRRLPDYYNTDEMAGLVAAWDGDATPLGLRNSAMLHLLYATGIRASELCGLNRGDFEPQARLLRVRGKGGRERVVPYGAKAAAALERWLKLGRPHLSSGGDPAAEPVPLSSGGPRAADPAPQDAHSPSSGGILPPGSNEQGLMSNEPGKSNEQGVMSKEPGDPPHPSSRVPHPSSDPSTGRRTSGAGDGGAAQVAQPPSSGGPRAAEPGTPDPPHSLLLTPYSTRPEGAALFLNHRGGRLTRRGLHNVVDRSALKAGLVKALSTHKLRHACATHLLEGGADVRLVQELLGHQSLATTQIYTQVTRTKLLEAFENSHPRAKK